MHLSSDVSDPIATIETSKMTLALKDGSKIEVDHIRIEDASVCSR